MAIVCGGGGGRGWDVAAAGTIGTASSEALPRAPKGSDGSLLVFPNTVFVDASVGIAAAGTGAEGAACDAL